MNQPTPDPPTSNRPINVFASLLIASALTGLELYWLPALSKLLPRCEHLHLLATLCLALAAATALYWRSAVWDKARPLILMFFLLFSALLMYFAAPFFC